MSALRMNRAMPGAIQRNPMRLRRLAPRPFRPCRCQPGPEEPKPTGNGPKEMTKEDTVLMELKKTGMTAAKARTLLKTWSDIGVEDAKQLQKLLVKRSIQPLQGITFQTILDAIAGAGGLYLVDLVRHSEDFTGRIFVESLGYFFFLYYMTQVFLDVSVAGAILYSAYRYGTSSVELLAAVKKLAGPQMAGLSVVEKAQVAVNTIKVLQAMENIAGMLQDQYGVDPSSKPSDSLKNLSAYLTLAHARDELGFDPAAYGLTEKEAGNIAYAFSVYDANDNGKLELSELSSLCHDLDEGCPLDADELAVAYKNLDVNNSGYIEFNDFVNWWVKKRVPQKM